MEPASPERQSQSKYTKGIKKICGRGSQMPPSCAKPGVKLSITRFAIFKWDSASPYAVIYPCEYDHAVAITPARKANRKIQLSGLKISPKRLNILNDDFLITNASAMFFIARGD